VPCRCAERREIAESIIRVRKHARAGEARQRRVYNAIRVDSVPTSCAIKCVTAVFCTFATNRKGVCDFLLVINSNLARILRRF